MRPSIRRNGGATGGVPSVLTGDAHGQTAALEELLHRVLILLVGRAAAARSHEL
jgi:hypothetical protein